MSVLTARVRPKGQVNVLPLRRDPFEGRSAAHLLSILKYAVPSLGQTWEVNIWRIRNFPNVWRGLWRIWAASLYKVPTHYGVVFARVQRGVNGPWQEFGLASLRVITDAGVADIVTRFAGTSAASIANYKYHGFGTGTGNEAAADTTLGTELTTQYVVDSTRPTGSQASATNTYTTVGTLSPDSGGTIAVTEHGVFSASSSGTLLDRSKFSAVNLVASADSLQVTYVLTLASGG